MVATLADTNESDGLKKLISIVTAGGDKQTPAVEKLVQMIGRFEARAAHN